MVHNTLTNQVFFMHDFFFSFAVFFSYIHQIPSITMIMAYERCKKRNI